MRTLLQVLATGAVLLLDTGSASASDCSCGQLWSGGCFEAATIEEHVPAEPLWCERSDDPRCMPANTHGANAQTFVPVAMSWARPLRWGAALQTSVRPDAPLGDQPGSEHSRRVERPPR